MLLQQINPVNRINAADYIDKYKSNKIKKSNCFMYNALKSNSPLLLLILTYFSAETVFGDYEGMGKCRG